MFDTHAHLTDDKLFNNITEILSYAKQSGVTDILCVCDSDTDLTRGIEVQQIADTKGIKIHLSAGIHPHTADLFVNTNWDEQYQQWIKVCKEIIAIGEIGLDYYYKNSDPESQKKNFREQLKLAKKNGLPAIIHCRDAINDTINILKEENINAGVMHCFSGNIDDMKKFVELGFYISISGIVTFPKAVTLHEVTKQVPVDRVVIETDCPYLAPQPFRGKLNEPSYIKYTLSRIAEIRNIEFENCRVLTSSNAKKLFNIG